MRAVCTIGGVEVRVREDRLVRDRIKAVTRIGWPKSPLAMRARSQRCLTPFTSRSAQSPGTDEQHRLRGALELKRRSRRRERSAAPSRSRVVNSHTSANAAVGAAAACPLPNSTKSILTVGAGALERVLAGEIERARRAPASGRTDRNPC